MQNNILVTAAATRETRLAGETASLNIAAGWQNPNSEKNSRAPIARFVLDQQIDAPVLLVPGVEISLFEVHSQSDKAPHFRLSVSVPKATATEILGKRVSGRTEQAVSDAEIQAALEIVRKQKAA